MHPIGLLLEKKTMDDSLPPNDLDIIHDDLVRRSADSGYLETSYNSATDSVSSPPQLTALYPEPDADSSSDNGGILWKSNDFITWVLMHFLIIITDTHYSCYSKERELPTPLVSSNLEPCTNSSVGANNNEESSSSSRFDMTTVDGLVVCLSIFFVF